jgi:hypothetical protein
MQGSSTRRSTGCSARRRSRAWRHRRTRRPTHLTRHRSRRARRGSSTSDQHEPSGPGCSLHRRVPPCWSGGAREPLQPCGPRWACSLGAEGRRGDVRRRHRSCCGIDGHSLARGRSMRPPRQSASTHFVDSAASDLLACAHRLGRLGGNPTCNRLHARSVVPTGRIGREASGPRGTAAVSDLIAKGTSALTRKIKGDP